jgi:hypothetical protein
LTFQFNALEKSHGILGFSYCNHHDLFLISPHQQRIRGIEMKVFQITEKDGTDWGFWAAADRDEAIGMLAAEAAADPEAFPGFDSEAGFIITEE